MSIVEERERTDNIAENGSVALIEKPAPVQAQESEEVVLPEEVLLNDDESISLMERLLNDPSSYVRNVQYGEVVEGTIMFKDRDEILVDIGAKSEGIVPQRERQSLTTEEMQNMKVGDGLLVFVVQTENHEGQAVLSIDKARMERTWRSLEKVHEAGETVEGLVYGANKGGLLVTIESVRGFVPTSQISGLSGSDEAKQASLSRLVNNKLLLKIVEINRSRNRLILSERQAAQEKRNALKERLMSELEQGQIRDGIVTSVCDFGVFVDIGGADGLVHLSELSWSRVNHPRELFKSGDSVKVYVLSIDENSKKVALSIKRTQAEPWTQVATNFEPGQVVEGVITKVAKFGAFARIADGVEGLIHVSELSEERVQEPSNVVKEGDNVKVRIISIDSQNRRMGLSIKKAAADYDETETARDEETSDERELEAVEA
jgi:small subunit ribosomal protein S1